MRFRPQVGYGQLAWALSGSTVQDETSTASNADAGTVFSWSSRAFRHRRSRVPWKYQSEPLSARIAPYRFMARSTTRAMGLNPDRSNPAFGPKRVGRQVEDRPAPGSRVPMVPIRVEQLVQRAGAHVHDERVMVRPVLYRRPRPEWVPGPVALARVLEL